MNNSSERKELFIQEFRKIYGESNVSRVKRDDFIGKSSIHISRGDIEKLFESWTKFLEVVGSKPNRYVSISDEELFLEYRKVYNKLGYYPLGAKGEKELSENSKYSGGSFKKRFGGLKNFLFEFKVWEKQQKENQISQKNITRKARIVLRTEDTSDVSDLIFATKIPKNATTENRIFKGAGGEYLVLAELLFRDFNASKMAVDEGLDIFAVKGEKLYLIQVKHSEYLGKNKSGLIKITLSSLQKHQKNNVYYIFVLSRKELGKRDFLILPYSKLDELIITKVIKKENEAKQVSFYVLHKMDEDDAYINEISAKNEVSRYLNAWDVLL